MSALVTFDRQSVGKFASEFEDLFYKGDAVGMASEISYAVCTLLLHFQLPDGQIVDKVVKDITIWRRQVDGTWRIEVDISNPIPKHS